MTQSKDFEMDPLDFQVLLNDLCKDEPLTPVYVADDRGRFFQGGRLEERTITDGSKIKIIVLSDAVRPEGRHVVPFE